MGQVIYGTRFRRPTRALTVAISLPVLPGFGHPVLGDQQHERGSLYDRWQLACDRLGADDAVALVLRRVADLTRVKLFDDRSYYMLVRQMDGHGQVLTFLPSSWYEKPHGDNILFYVVGALDRERTVAVLIKHLHAALS